MIFLAIVALVLGVIAAILVAGFYILMFVVGVVFLILVGISFGLGNIWDLDPKSVMWLGMIPLTAILLLAWGYIDSRREAARFAREKTNREAERQRNRQAPQRSVRNWIRRWF